MRDFSAHFWFLPPQEIVQPGFVAWSPWVPSQAWVNEGVLVSLIRARQLSSEVAIPLGFLNPCCSDPSPGANLPWVTLLAIATYTSSVMWYTNPSSAICWRFFDQGPRGVIPNFTSQSRPSTHLWSLIQATEKSFLRRVAGFTLTQPERYLSRITVLLKSKRASRGDSGILIRIPLGHLLMEAL